MASCPDCFDPGNDFKTGDGKCSNCAGNGVEPLSFDPVDGVNDCTNCHGSGECPTCNGTGDV